MQCLRKEASVGDFERPFLKALTMRLLGWTDSVPLWEGIEEAGGGGEGAFSVAASWRVGRPGTMSWPRGVKGIVRRSLPEPTGLK